MGYLNQPTKKKRDFSESVDKSNGIARKKERYMEQSVELNNNNSDSTFLYKPGVELPSLYNFTNLTVRLQSHID